MALDLQHRFTRYTPGHQFQGGMAMSRIFSVILAAALTTILVVSAHAASGPSFGTVVDNLDVRKSTKLHVREYWKSIQDQQVSWSGDAWEVQGGAKSRVKLYLADKSRPLYKGYNIIVTSSDVDKAANIKKGQRVRFTGTLRAYNSKRAGAVIEISEATLQ